MHVANGATAETKTVGAGRQLLAGDQVGRLVRVEGERDPELSVGKHAVHLCRIGRKGFAIAPQVGVQLVQVGPERRSGAGKGGGRHFLLQHHFVRGQFQQQLFDEGGAVKIWRFGVTDAPRIGFGKGQQVCSRPWRYGRFGAVGNERELCRAPG